MRFEIEYKISSTGGIFTTYADNLSDIKDGFWVTKDGQFTKATDNHAFILPHMIRYILKL